MALNVSSQFFRFILVGSLAAVVHSVVVFCTEFAVPQLHLNVSNLVGFSMSFPISFYGQRKFTFKSEAKEAGEIWRFLATQIFGFFINSVVVFILIYVSGQENSFFVLIGIAVAVVNVFLLSKFWTFRTRSEPDII
jgi:putative flippase GtrA